MQLASLNTATGYFALRQDLFTEFIQNKYLNFYINNIIAYNINNQLYEK